MKLKKWTIKQVIFEREMNHPNYEVYFDGFKIPKEKDFLLAVLEELYKQYGDKNRERNLKFLNEYLKNGIKYVRVFIVGTYRWIYKKNDIILDTAGKHIFPEQNELCFEPKTIWGHGKDKRGEYISEGYHIHKHCLVNPLTGK